MNMSNLWRVQAIHKRWLAILQQGKAFKQSTDIDTFHVCRVQAVHSGWFSGLHWGQALSFELFSEVCLQNG